jgi:hypothetical protein
MMKMKPVVCEKCGKKLDGFVPEDATDIICFACNEFLSEHLGCSNLSQINERGGNK